MFDLFDLLSALHKPGLRCILCQSQAKYWANLCNPSVTYLTFFLQLLFSIFPSLPVLGLSDLIRNILTFSLAGFFSCGQGHIAGRWSYEQNAWQGLRWTGQWVVECWGWGFGVERLLNVRDEVSDMEGKRWEIQKSQGTLACCSLSRWPLSLSHSRRMCLPATQSIILTPTAEQHLFIRLDRWRRDLWKRDESGSDIIHRPRNYAELM